MRFENPIKKKIKMLENNKNINNSDSDVEVLELDNNIIDIKDIIDENDKKKNIDIILEENPSMAYIKGVPRELELTSIQVANVRIKFENAYPNNSVRKIV